MCDDRRIEIPANLIADVRLGALEELHLAAERAHEATEAFYYSEWEGWQHDVYVRHSDALNSLMRWTALIDDLGDDYRVEEAVRDLRVEHATLVFCAARGRGETLRSRLTDREDCPAHELVECAQRIEALEAFADSLPEITDEAETDG